VDAVLLVVNAGTQRTTHLQQAISHLSLLQAPLLGVVLNRVGEGRSDTRGRYKTYEAAPAGTPVLEDPVPVVREPNVPTQTADSERA